MNDNQKNNNLSKFWNLMKKPAFYIPLVILIFIIIFSFFGHSSTPNYDVIVAKRGNIVQEVSVTGQVKSQEQIDLAFEKGGRISSVNVSVGNKVSSGQILLRLVDDDIVAQLSQAQADAAAQESKLEQLQIGTRPEELQVTEAKVASAQVALDNTERSLVSDIQSAYTQSDDAVRNKVDQFFTNPRGSNPVLSFSIDNFQLKTNLETSRLSVEAMLLNWQSSLNNLSISGDLSSYYTSAKNNLDQVRAFLDKAALAVNSAAASVSLSQTTIDGWKSSVSAGRSSLDVAIASLSTAENAFQTAASDLALSQQELNLEKAGSTAQEIAGQQAAVDQAEASVRNYQAQVDKSILRSPINGIVTRQDANVGEIIPANINLVSLNSENKFKIEANIPETDITKVKIGDTAKITLDAFGSDVIFDATVIAIDPAETIIEGVATYKTTFQFSKEDVGIKAGMTANIDILTEERDNVIVLPQRAVVSQNSEKIVKVLGKNGSINDVQVEIGLKGSDGNVEITKGINEGDQATLWH